MVSQLCRTFCKISAVRILEAGSRTMPSASFQTGLGARRCCLPRRNDQCCVLQNSRSLGFHPTKPSHCTMLQAIPDMIFGTQSTVCPRHAWYSKSLQTVAKGMCWGFFWYCFEDIRSLTESMSCTQTWRAGKRPASTFVDLPDPWIDSEHSALCAIGPGPTSGNLWGPHE